MNSKNPTVTAPTSSGTATQGYTTLWGLTPVVGLPHRQHCGNRRPRVERLVSAWNQGTRGDTDPEGETDDPLIDASVEPKQRPRTRLTDEEVDAMRTARAQGISVIALAKQFGVHRGTVWAKSR